jgi:hypothetical protein
MKSLFFNLFICLFLTSCNTDAAQKNEIGQRSPTDLVPEPDLNIRLEGAKQIIDSNLINAKQAALKYIKVEGEKTPRLVEISNEEDNETEYYIYKDSTKAVKAILDIVSSKSGDWYLETRHYFDKNGQVFAFQKDLNTFYNSDCASDGKSISVATIEYLQRGKIVSKFISKKDAKDVKITNEKCSFQDRETPVYMSLADWSKATKIDLSNQ